ncbi:MULTISPECIES: CHAD domain-containing protein [unclassified Ruegeria]|uniref:CHAD domain-containing protein n=1 Tax=unclassified Ruegeria TaxID=2625375 RepID=UPI00148979F9|nr:CHAD domain-containing protein [Ruegeria sp. HKCCD4332]NOD87150.1 CHAD domain-containing protein [Ruegeria sp. HKCCD4318]NOE12705.1 CHAD domain-containing protein [Ruegeria sp. HKCCD4318-2]NOG09130.1 CHAD domain-containing protein [Ruegeria sp. HKCCD4315]
MFEHKKTKEGSAEGGMTVPPEALFFLSSLMDTKALEASLTGLTLVIEPKGTSKPFSLLDCHDQTQRAAGRVLIESGAALHLLQKGQRPLSQNGMGNGRFVQNLPDGEVRAALQDFPTLRALMQIGVGKLKEKSFVVLDELQKTQVRGVIWSMTSTSGRATVVRLHGLRGYERAYQKVCSSIVELPGCAQDVEALYAGLFPGLVTYRAKPEIALGKTEPSLEVATDIIHTYLKVARQNEEGMVADIDTEFLHDYRVSLRKIRSVVSLFKGVFSEDQTADLKRVFSDLMAPTGRLRDLDVYLLEKDMYFSLIPANLHLGLRAMFDQFQKERKQELSRLSRRLRSRDYDASMNRLIEKFDGTAHLQPGPNSDRGAYDYACALIWKRYRKVCKIARSITDDTPDETVHDLRIDCKKLRYLMEFFAPLFDAKAFKKILKPLKKLQDNLGLFNDYSVQQEALLTFVSQQSNAQGRVDAQIGLAAGGLISVLDQRQKFERSRVITSFRHFDSPETQHLFRSLFHHNEE